MFKIGFQLDRFVHIGWQELKGVFVFPGITGFLDKQQNLIYDRISVVVLRSIFKKGLEIGI